jgi:hypothetical protein
MNTKPQWTAKEAYAEGFAHATSRHLQGILALPRPLAVDGEKYPYLKGVVQALRLSLENAERALAEAEAAQDRAVSIREEYDDPGAPPDYFNDQESLG